MSQNNPPFQIGQEIIRIGQSSNKMKKGNHYFVKDMFYCIKCNTWYVSLANTSSVHGDKFFGCDFCGDRISTYRVSEMIGAAKNFAPIQSNYSDATA